MTNLGDMLCSNRPIHFFGQLYSLYTVKNDNNWTVNLDFDLW